VVVFNVHDNDRVLLVSWFYFYDKSPFVIQSQRVLVSPVSFEFLKVIAPDGVEITLIRSGSDNLYPLPVCLNDSFLMAGREARISFKAIQVFIFELNVHLVLPVLIMPNSATLTALRQQQY